jgi:hypothetical protein
MGEVRLDGRLAAIEAENGSKEGCFGGERGAFKSFEAIEGCGVSHFSI